MSTDPDLPPGALHLIGQYDSPFVRRVGIALTHAGIAFCHHPWSSFGDARRLRAINPLTRVPTMVLEDGGVLVDSHAMLDHIDRRSAVAMRPAGGAARDAALRIEGLATGLADKAVALFYEMRLHDQVSPQWVARCREQIAATALALEAEAVGRADGFWFGDSLSHADIALACAWRFVREAHPGLLAQQRLLTLVAQCAALERLPVFQAVAQPFIPPA
jgi:glutathione S-transferase